LKAEHVVVVVATDEGYEKQDVSTIGEFYKV
jgi:hypothetical protein